jgi:hypothetical protein
VITKVFAVLALALAGVTIWLALTQQTALVLRQENQDQHWSRSGTTTYGRYSATSGQWQGTGPRGVSSNFQGGGPGAGK